MTELKVASWDYLKNPNCLEKVLMKGYDYWEHLLNQYFVKDFVILSTCNRLEVYSTTDIDLIDIPDFSTSTIYSGLSALDHLIRVSSGLESMSVGENDILRQVKEAYEVSLKRGYTNKLISVIFRKAISVGKLVREKTMVSHGKVSIPALSIDILDSEAGVKDKKIAIIGTGKMASDIIKYVTKLNPSLVTVAGRSIENAKRVAMISGARYTDLSDISNLLNENDVIITATSSKNALIDNDLASGISSQKFMMDISNPKNIDIDPTLRQNIKIITLADIQPILEGNRKTKEKEIAKVEKIVKEEVESLNIKLKEQSVEELISDFYLFSRLIKEEEVEKLENAIRNGEDVEAAIRAMTSSLVNKILAPQTLTLKQLVKSENDEMFDLFLRRFYENFHRKIIAALRKPGDREENQNQRDQIPQLDQKP